MLSRFGIALAVCLLTLTSASAQVVRFETSVGDFDMVLNPTNNPVLQGHVDNMLQYVEDNRYNGTWINRADTGFVLQMGGFYTHTKRPPAMIASTRPVLPYESILEGEPASETGLSNTTGTVAMALPGGAGGTNQNGGTSSFFVNLADTNTFLNTDFTVFAAISDMTVINQIMALDTIDRTTEPDFGAGGGNLAFSDVPIDANGFQVLINRAFVISDAMSVARAKAGVQSIVSQSLAANADASSEFAALSGGGSSNALQSASVVPEPAAALLMLLGATGIGVLRVRPRRR